VHETVLAQRPTLWLALMLALSLASCSTPPETIYPK
jgi:hypothetical protein